MAAEALDEKVLPFARGLIADHQAAGRPVVLATTTPADLVEPLAERLGLDAVVATRYGLDPEGRYDGSIRGEFVWGAGKLSAVRRWAAAHDVDLADSYAYSDSFYDTFLLGAVGHPFAVNPDPRLRVLAVARRWPALHLDVPPGVPKLVGLEPQQVAMLMARTVWRTEFIPYANFDIGGTENIPATGPAIVCANHRSYLDPLVVGYTTAQRGRPIRFLGKKEVLDAPVVGDVVRAMGTIRVDRGTGSDEPLRAAAAALDAGELVAIMPQGTIPRGRAFFEPVLTGRWGAARLAAMTGAPVVPIGLWGTEQVWPRSSRVPEVWNVVDPPLIRIRVGPTFTVEGHDTEHDTAQIMEAIVAQLPEEARRPHEPTPEELARSLPPGAIDDAADAEHEATRRPGTD